MGLHPNQQNAFPQLRKLKSNHVLLLLPPSAKLKMLSAKKSPMKRDARKSSTNNAPNSEPTLSTSVLPKLKPKLIPKLSMLVFPPFTVLPLCSCCCRPRCCPCPCCLCRPSSR